MARNNLPPGPGRPKGLPNKATQEARAAIGMFVDQNAHRLQEWLDRLADGVKDDKGDYIIPPNPEKAASLFTGIIEYHVPKLARSEHVGANGGNIGVDVNIKSLPPDEAYKELLK